MGRVSGTTKVWLHTLSWHQVLLSVMVLLQLTSPAASEVFTSSLKMEKLAAVEGSLLKYVVSLHEKADLLRKFAETRQELTEAMSEETSGHPNAAYFLVKAFVHHWANVINDDPELQKLLTQTSSELPSQVDVDGALAAILRLQRVYNLSTSQIYAGNYSGYTGPVLSPLDAYAIGREGFTAGMLDQSEEWLRLATTEMQKAREQTSADFSPNSGTKLGFTEAERAAAIALLGRVNKFRGNDQLARELYEESISIDPTNGDAQQLAKELRTIPGAQNVVEKDVLTGKVNQLCSRPKNVTVEKMMPYHRCRYRTSLYLPYVQYKEEIISLVPYASVFYDMIHDAEIEQLKAMTSSKLYRAAVEYSETSYRRTSDLGWFHDTDHPLAARLSARVKDVTWLQVDERFDGISSGEPFQVVNYGLGGHYSPHFDKLEDPGVKHLKQAGTRIATFLLYLTDVDMGGYTVFVDADISVAPVKGMALFWYNVNPAQEQELLSLHAGCPVLKGHKWIANKWIWTYGNMYRRPCGSRPDSTQLEVEEITFSRRHNILP